MPDTQSRPPRRQPLPTTPRVKAGAKAGAATAAWFLARMDDCNLSLRGVARMMDLDPSALSRAVNCQRKFQVHELDRLCEILGVSVDEAKRRLGIKPGKVGGMTAVDGVVSADGAFTHQPNLGEVPTPPGLPEGGSAFICRTGISGCDWLDLFDGWVFFCGPKIEPGHFLNGKMGLFLFEKSNKWLFGRISRGSIIGKWNFSGAEKLSNVNIKFAKMIFWAQV